MEMQPPAGLICRQRQPENLESPRSIFESFLTPRELFYVRSHFDTPHIEVASWRLEVAGEIERSLSLTFTQLLDAPQRNVTATLECAGNSRSFLPKPVKGLDWGLGAVGTAQWTGVPLSWVIERARMRNGAVSVILEGADTGYPENETYLPGPIAFAYGLDIEKAFNADVLLAWQMNGRELDCRHGFPLRAVVPGWYGMASVKWLRRIIVSNLRFQGYFQTFEYSRWQDLYGIPSLAPLTHGEVKAEIAYPAAGESLAAGTACTVHGAAWAGESEIEQVEISGDGGLTWTPACLLDPPRPYCWVRWQFPWTPRRAGRFTLMARAYARDGRIQPFRRDPRERTYSVHHVLPVPVKVR
jgi:DMSO/TMAO reductase YedYZ molybdopterin-dependent catalytic subunit